MTRKRHSTTLQFWLYFALGLLAATFIAAVLSATLTDTDRRAIELMLDRTVP